MTSAARAISSQQSIKSLISDSEREFIIQGIRDDCRLDGRQRTEFRRHHLATGVLPLSHGSARSLHSRGCLCSVKAELVRPTLDAPDRGIVSVEILDDQKKHHQRLALMEEWCQQALAERLCLLPGVVVWKLHIDVSSNGETNMTAIAQCVRYALTDTILPRITILEEESNLKTSALDRVHLEDGDGYPLVDSVEDLPCLVTINVVDNTVAVLDATVEEDLVASCIVHVVVAPNQSILGVSAASGRLPLSMVDKCIPLAIQALPSIKEACKLVRTKGLLRGVLALE